MFSWFSSRTRVREAGYSVELQRTGRECVNAVYREGQLLLSFGGEFVGKEWNQVNLSAPQNLTPENTPRVLQNLGAALTKMRYEYLIVKTHLDPPYPVEEQQAAIYGLRAMGFAAEVRPDRSVKLTPLQGARPAKPSDAPAAGVSMMQLARIASGKRSHLEVLAKSGAAVVDFV